MTDPHQKYREGKESVERAVEDGNICVRDKDLIFELCAAYDSNDSTTPLPSTGKWANDTKPKEITTLHYWTQHLKRVALRLGFEPYDTTLSDADADVINELMKDSRTGVHPDVKDGGFANNTIRNQQCCCRRFYRYHEHLGVEPTDINLTKGDGTYLDPVDMLRKEEIGQIREVADHPRDLALFDILLYTGQRNTAVRSLRIKDVDLQAGVYRLNTDADGLKGADKHGTKRPLLGAVGSIRAWLNSHPFPDTPDAYLITPLPDFSTPDPHRMVSTNTLNYALKNMKRDASIDKPLTAHTLRHNFVTLAKREYGIDDSTVKYLIGHRPESQVMETTYAHLSDDDFLHSAEESAGICDPANISSLSPDECHCGASLSANAKACERCGTVYTPDAYTARLHIAEGMQETYR